MKKFLLLFSVVLYSLTQTMAQSSETGLQGRVIDDQNEPIEFATVTIFKVVDSVMVKAGYADQNGSFVFSYLKPDQYYLNISFVGFDTHLSAPFQVVENKMTSLGTIQMSPFATALGEVVVASTRPVIEVKPDKTVFNIEGSINAIGNDALELLRKAPGVVVDNNERLMLVGKTGVKVYIDGKQSILKGDDLAAYLKTIQSSQIEAIEIITQPSSRYEAEGNAGIINIRLIKDKSLGTNATLSLGHNQAIHSRSNGNISINNRTQKLNVFANLNYATGESSSENKFTRTTADLYITQDNQEKREWDNLSLRGGFDVTTGKHSTVGFLFSGYMNDAVSSNRATSSIFPAEQAPVTELLEATNLVTHQRNNYNFNGNYRFDNRSGTVVNVDVDYGSYSSDGTSHQPNFYYDPMTGQLTDTRIFQSNSPTTIDIATLKLDYEKTLWDGTLGAGVKLAKITTDNNYEFFDVVDDIPILNIDRTNQFVYEEDINAAYINYGKQWKKIAFQFGVRVELTDSKGDLSSLKPDNDQTVKQNYTDVFPSGGITYQLSQKHSLRLNYSKRIDRPNYQDLNPFEFKLDELTFQKGNPFLRPQYSDNFSIGHTFNYTLNTNLSFSQTNDLMAELTDTAGMGAAFLTTENVAQQNVIALTVSYPYTISKSWNAFTNIGVTNTHNQADFGDGKTIDIRATTFNIYSQHSFMLPKNFTFEISGWYNSPGIWGGNFATDDMFSIDAGIQKRILDNRGNIKIGIADIFKSQGWSGRNNFGALAMRASGDWESRQVKINFTYLMGNKDVKSSRKRSTGLEDESNRIKG